MRPSPEAASERPDDPADLGAGKPLAHQVSPKRLLGSGACGLLEIFLNQQICYWTGVLCTGRQLADARLVCGVYSPFRFSQAHQPSAKRDWTKRRKRE